MTTTHMATAGLLKAPFPCFGGKNGATSAVCQAFGDVLRCVEPFAGTAALLTKGWHTRTWKAGGGYARSEEAIENRLSETLWCSPHCLPEVGVQVACLFGHG